MANPHAIIGSHDVLMITLDTLRYDVAQRLYLAGRTPNLADVLPDTGWERRPSWNDPAPTPPVVATSGMSTSIAFSYPIRLDRVFSNESRLVTDSRCDGKKETLRSSGFLALLPTEIDFPSRVQG